MTAFVPIANGAAVPLADLPSVGFSLFSSAIVRRVEAGERLACLTGARGERGNEVIAVLADDANGHLYVGRASLPDRYPSLTLDCPQAHAFERELAEQLGVVPEGHPWLKPIRSPDRTRTQRDDVAGAAFFRVEGEEIHEVAVGPVHAGVIEPGHFRFQCHGEQVFHLEIALGYQHRGIENGLLGGPFPLTWPQLETAAGDTTTGHGWSHALVLEALCGIAAPPRAEAIRMIALELERLANHTGDLGALAGDVGYLPTAAFCGRIRGDFLNLTAAICGSRLGRSLLRTGGVRFDLGSDVVSSMRDRLAAAARDVTGAVELLFSRPSVESRFERSGILSERQARELGVVGVAARASGLERDVRTTLPRGGWSDTTLKISTAPDGDVASRALVRWREIQESLKVVRALLEGLPEGPIVTNPAPPRPGLLAVALVEGWRGEVLHLATTGADGRFSRYKIVDPSFHNWFALAMAMRNEQISDFPMINKSFNLSYCGHDL